MEITKELRISKVIAAHVQNAPFQLVLEVKRRPYLEIKDSTLNMDAGTCERYSIPMSLDITGCILQCVLQSKELPLRQNGPLAGYPAIEKVQSDELGLDSLSWEEHTWVNLWDRKPKKLTENFRMLYLSSFGGGDGIHPQPLPCPFYKLNFELTEEEYKDCKNLPALSVFKVTFKLG